jgi:hypothetical protein
MPALRRHKKRRNVNIQRLPWRAKTTKAKPFSKAAVSPELTNHRNLKPNART